MTSFDENTPLLDASSSSNQIKHTRVSSISSSSSSTASESVTSSAIDRKPSLSHWQTYVWIFVLQFITNFSFYLVSVPIVKLFEQRVCETYYGRNYDGDESLCKIPTIQDKVAYLLGLKATFDALPGILTSVWYGSLADRIGRRPIVVLSSLGELASTVWLMSIGLSKAPLKAELLWLSSPFLLVGGGKHLLLSIYYTMLTDVVPEVDRAQSLLYTYAIIYINSLIAPPLGAALMVQDLSLPFLAVIFLIIARFIPIMFLSETVKAISPLRTGSKFYAEPSCKFDEDSPSSTSASVQKPSRPPVRNVMASAKMLELIKSPYLRFCFACFFLKKVAFASESLLYIYTSELLHQKLYKTAWIKVAQASGATIVTGLLLPALVQILLRRDFTPELINLWMTRGSLITLTFGFLMVWMSPHAIVLGFGIFFCGCGEGLEPFLRALASSLVDKSSNATLFTTIGVVDTCAKLLGGPVMAKLFSIRSREGQPLGLPFLVSSVIFAGLWVVSYLMPPSLKFP